MTEANEPASGKDRAIPEPPPTGVEAKPPAPRNNRRGDELREKRELEKAESKARRIALQACLLPFLIAGIAIVGIEVLKQTNLIFGLINLAIALYATTCTIRTWVNIFRDHRSLWLQAIVGTVLNGGLLYLIAMAIAALYSARH